MAQERISGMTAAPGGVTATADRFEISRETAPGSGVWETYFVTQAQIAAYVNAILTVGASAGMNTFAEVEAALALKGGDAANPLVAPYVYDEFDYASTEAGEIGQMGWGFTNGTFTLANPEANHPGICRRTSTAVAATIASMYSGGGGASPAYRFDQINEQVWIIKPGSTDADYDLRFGFSTDFTSDAPIHGFYFEKLAADPTWFAVSRAGSVQTRTAMAAFVADWTKLKLRRVDATKVAFSINGGAETEIAANIPAATVTLVFGSHIIPRSANARTYDVDYYSHRLLAQTR